MDLDLTRELDLLHGTMRDGFQGVHDRLDKLNSRTGSAEQELARHDERIKTLKAEITADTVHTTKIAVTKAGAILAGLGALGEVIHRYFW